MNARLIGLVSVASIAASLAAGCSAAPTPEEGVDHSDQALPIGSSSGGGCVGPNCFHGWTCGTAVPLNPYDPNDFEQGLLKLQCNPWKTPIHSTANGQAEYETWCPSSTWAYNVWCPASLSFVNTNAGGYQACWHAQPPVYADLYSQDLCGRNVPPGDVVIAFDPNCGGDCGSRNTY